MKRLIGLAMFIISWSGQTPGQPMIADYFARETARVSQRALAEVRTLQDWQARRPTHSRQLLEPCVTGLRLTQLPATLAGGPAYPGILRCLDLRQILTPALPRSIVMTGANPAEWGWPLKAASLAAGRITFTNSDSNRSKGKK